MEMRVGHLKTSFNNNDEVFRNKKTQKELIIETSVSSTVSIRKVFFIIASLRNNIINILENENVQLRIPDLGLLISDNGPKNTTRKVIDIYDSDIVEAISKDVSKIPKNMIERVIELYTANVVSSIFSGVRANFSSLIYTKIDYTGKVFLTAGSTVLKKREQGKKIKILTKLGE